MNDTTLASTSFPSQPFGRDLKPTNGMLPLEQLFVPTLSGTASPYWAWAFTARLDTDQPFIFNKGHYFTIKSYERSEGLHSSVMFQQWGEGKLAGPKYTNWLNSYLNIWDKISEARDTD
jgi:hypothetical protein